ncbi:HDIG domain-containing metalloprotein [Salidesulfovibrio onnuriiensis]|uniref:HDIG domain-containing metalloprotein n=1 Tax=Salidesulfovibrio onnuriiensis TaxID=2583823 RepID=UPI0011CB44D4|nr:HDIG domain-containing metalloprotein [Salidesulfovibrio onnuriiensis]
MTQPTLDHETVRKPFLPKVPAPPGARIDPAWHIPGDEECFSLWDKFEMFENVRRHSMTVAEVATCVAQRGLEHGYDVNVRLIRASALLHDLAKTYSIKFGGNHSQLGGAWVQDLTGNPVLASGVTHHVYWPFDIDLNKYFHQLAVLYADKRVQHDIVVGVEPRFDDLIKRYGTTDLIASRIRITKTQAIEVERTFDEALGITLNECSFDSGRME